MHVDAPGRAAQGTSAVRSVLLHGGIAAAADRVRAVPAAWRRTRVRILRRPWRAKLLHAHAAVLTLHFFDAAQFSGSLPRDLP